MPTGPTRHPVGDPPVSVPELLARHGEAPGVPAPREPDLSTVDTGQLFLAELSRREGRPEDGPPPAVPRASLRAPALGTVLVLAAVLAIGLAARAGDRPDRVVAATPPAVTPPAGAEVLRPDLLRDLVAPGDGAPPEPRGPGGGAPSALAEAADDFFETAPRAPRRALALLDAPLRGDDTAFVAAWEQVGSAAVTEVTPLSGDEARVVTALVFRGGGTLLTVHRLTLRTGVDPPLVTAAELVSVSAG